MKSFNWAIWAGFVLSVFAFLSYPLIFVNWAVTRDFPWANLFFFAVAAGLLFIGVRRAFTPNRRRPSKIVAAIVATLSTLLLGMFIFTAFVAARWLPASAGAPQVGQAAQEFSLIDINGRATSLSELRSQPINGKPAKGVLLIFYRGYW
jgi:hypothetical protein